MRARVIRKPGERWFFSNLRCTEQTTVAHVSPEKSTRRRNERSTHCESDLPQNSSSRRYYRTLAHQCEGSFFSLCYPSIFESDARQRRACVHTSLLRRPLDSCAFSVACTGVKRAERSAPMPQRPRTCSCEPLFVRRAQPLPSPVSPSTCFSPHLRARTFSLCPFGRTGSLTMIPWRTSFPTPSFAKRDPPLGATSTFRPSYFVLRRASGFVGPRSPPVHLWPVFPFYVLPLRIIIDGCNFKKGAYRIFSIGDAEFLSRSHIYVQRHLHVG